MNSVNVDKLRKYASLYNIVTIEAEKEYAGLLDYASTPAISNHSWLKFDVVPIINNDPLSREVFYGFKRTSSNDNWQEALLCYLILKAYIERVEMFGTKNKLTELSFEEQETSHIMFDALILSICGTDIEGLLARTKYNSVTYTNGLNYQLGYYE